jgi:hypothetical protein
MSCSTARAFADRPDLPREREGCLAHPSPQLIQTNSSDSYRTKRRDRLPNVVNHPARRRARAGNVLAVFERIALSPCRRQRQEQIGARDERLGRVSEQLMVQNLAQQHIIGAQEHLSRSSRVQRAATRKRIQNRRSAILGRLNVRQPYTVRLEHGNEPSTHPAAGEDRQIPPADRDQIEPISDLTTKNSQTRRRRKSQVPPPPPRLRIALGYESRQQPTSRPPMNRQTTSQRSLRHRPLSQQLQGPQRPNHVLRRRIIRNPHTTKKIP